MIHTAYAARYETVGDTTICNARLGGATSPTWFCIQTAKGWKLFNMVRIDPGFMAALPHAQCDYEAFLRSELKRVATICNRIGYKG